LACGATEEQLRARAAFDLNCSSEQLQLVEIDERTRGVTGCGQRTTYIESCAVSDGYGTKRDCTWVQNADTQGKPRVQP
jgi:hypothetical protein